MGWEWDLESLRGKSEVGRQEYGVGSKEFERKNKNDPFHAPNEQLQA